MNIRHGFSHAEVARTIGVPTEDIAKLAELDLQPECGSEGWSCRQVLGLAAKVHTLRAGATPEASNQAFWFLSMGGYYSMLRRYRAFGRQYLRLVGRTCVPGLMMEVEAFNPQVLRQATESGLNHLIFDVGHWIDRIEIERREILKWNNKAKASCG